MPLNTLSSQSGVGSRTAGWPLLAVDSLEVTLQPNGRCLSTGYVLSG